MRACVGRADVEACSVERTARAVGLSHERRRHAPFDVGGMVGEPPQSRIVKRLTAIVGFSNAAAIPKTALAGLVPDPSVDVDVALAREGLGHGALGGVSRLDLTAADAPGGTVVI